MICIHKIPSMKFAILETNFTKVSSLKILSHENIVSQAIINLTNGKCLYAQEHIKLTWYLYFWHAISKQYAAIMPKNRG